MRVPGLSIGKRVQSEFHGEGSEAPEANDPTPLK